MIPSLNASALLFSAKSFLAAMLALYIALRFQFANPYWAAVTTYVVAQPRAGAVLSKSVYRVIGTAAGATMSVLLVPRLFDAPELLAGAIALWLGFCTFVSSIDRTTRSYMFVLAGYSTCIIVFPTLSQPEEIFTTAISRVQEITLGILCSGLIHAVVLPNSSTKLMLSRLDAILKDAGRWTAAALSESRPEKLDDERRRLAVAVNEIHDLVIHSGYEGKLHPHRRRALRALLPQLERVLPLSIAIDDRLMELRSLGPLPTAISDLVADVSAWLSASPTDDTHLTEGLDRLRHRCAELEPDVTPEMTWSDALTLNLLARVSDLLLVFGISLSLRDELFGGWEKATIRRQNPSAGQAAGLKAGWPAGRPEGRDVDRDYKGALYASVSAAFALFLANALWVASGWQGGASGVMLTGVFFSLYSGYGNPALLLKNKFVGVVVRLTLGALYVLLVLPNIEGFPLLVLALSPVLLASAALLTVPRYSPLAFNLIIGSLSPSIIATRFTPDFATYMNNGLATLSGIYFALAMMRIMQSLWLDGTSARLIEAAWRDIARGRHSVGARWRSRMGHRVALLTTRIAQSKDEIHPAARALRDMRTGLSLAELGNLEPQLPLGAKNEIASIIHATRDHYRSLGRHRRAEPPQALLDRIDATMRLTAESSSAEIRRAGALSLTSLRRNLFPGLPGATACASIGKAA
ncbi:Uncharacterized membrane protein YccC [Faunimonas pinastri]|uniref:Uncharacterized membrane protein YccC n=1 Tax=Faunimonas pinastri TaxID=1855383 RepID=A0A1H9K8L9_9HYPH|nr:FUSC family protein [Faunimonas pinastri]SEQ95474.1 Uncharacterized membrane protein YccC [Faunimonas pinastri]